MLDRASSFADPEVIALLSSKLVPVALDCWVEERRKDARGDLYRKIVFQRDGMAAGRTTQGFYLFAPDGALIRGWNNRDVGKLRRYLQQTAADYRAAEPEAGPTEAPSDDAHAPALPDGGLVVDVFSRVLEATWPPEEGRWSKLFRGSTGRDHLWIARGEVAALARAELPDSLVDRIARFHLMDNTRGEPPFWGKAEVVRRELTVAPRDDAAPGQVAFAVSGRVTLEAKGRSFDAAVRGVVEVIDGEVRRFDLVAFGTYEGHGKYTSPSAPIGPFTFAVAFTVADPEAPATRVPPQGMKHRGAYWPRSVRGD